MNLPAQLKAWRRGLRLTQAGAAAKLGIPVWTYRNWEYGHRTPKGLARQMLESIIAVSGAISGKPV